MKSRMTPLALAGIVGVLGAASGHAQQNASAPAQVTQAITVVAQREPVITVLAPRETSNAAPAAGPRQTPPGIGTAVDADGDGIADAPTDAARLGKSRRPSVKVSVPVAAPGPECADKRRTAPASACAKGNPLNKDKAAQGQNPVHDP